ncbi:apolipoprotein A-IV isoform X1 [Lepisosteus oculatus]|uniref:apolipoprotein A-IV isoform X1 n=2 Tax=Lepisosteus oculatus TaxID=7918 RepID=UPI00372116C4
MRAQETMHLEAVVLALSLALVAAFPLHQDSGTGARAGVWDYLSHMANHVNDKTPQDRPSKEDNGLWKSRLESADLYADPQHGPLQLKPRLDSERLRARLLRELQELREKLSPYTQEARLQLAQIQDRLGPYAQGLRAAVSSNAQELCGHLHAYIQELESPGHAAQPSSPHQEVLQRVGQALDDSTRRLEPYLEEFKAQTARAVAELRESLAPPSGEAELWRRVQDAAARLLGGADGLGAGLRGRAGRLREQVGQLLVAAQPVRDRLSHSVARFCQDSSAQARDFGAEVETQLRELSQAGVPALPSLRAPGSLQEDFASQLSALLEDIRQNLS